MRFLRALAALAFVFAAVTLGGIAFSRVAWWLAQAPWTEGSLAACLWMVFALVPSLFAAGVAWDGSDA